MWESKLDQLCSGAVDDVVLTMLGTLRIDVFDCTMGDLDVIDDECGVHSVERQADGTLTIETEQQIAPCGC